MEHAEIRLRLSPLRMEKGVSARDMSLSIGQSASYINNIETGVANPSMQELFDMCEYLNITPAEFFASDTKNPIKVQELVDAVKGLSDEQLDILITLAKGLNK